MGKTAPSATTSTRPKIVRLTSISGTWSFEEANEQYKKAQKRLSQANAQYVKKGLSFRRSTSSDGNAPTQKQEEKNRKGKRANTKKKDGAKKGKRGSKKVSKPKKNTEETLSKKRLPENSIVTKPTRPMRTVV
jgi:hypothetical protein